jgi:hypothetical protein
MLQPTHLTMLCCRIPAVVVLQLQPNQVAVTCCVQFDGVSPSFLRNTQPRLAKLVLGSVDGQSLADTCKPLPVTCRALTGNFAALMGSCSRAASPTRRRATVQSCKVGLFKSAKMCPLGLADSKLAAGTNSGLWANTFLPQPSGSCTVMACNIDEGSNCFPLSLDLLKPPATSMTPGAAIAASVTVSCVNEQLVGDFTARDGYALANARIQTSCGSSWRDTPRFCPSRPNSWARAAVNGAAAAAAVPFTTTARVVSDNSSSCHIGRDEFTLSCCCSAWCCGHIAMHSIMRLRMQTHSLRVVAAQSACVVPASCHAQ